MGEENSLNQISGSYIVNIASQWADKPFNPDKIEQCCYFVRHIFSLAGKELAVTGNPSDGFFPTDEGYANSLAGDEVGIRIDKISELIEGDIVIFKNTYGDWPEGTITHVGIYCGKGEFIHRSTSSIPVKFDLISDKKWSEKFVEGRRVLK